MHYAAVYPYISKPHAYYYGISQVKHTLLDLFDFRQKRAVAETNILTLVETAITRLCSYCCRDRLVVLGPGVVAIITQRPNLCHDTEHFCGHVIDGENNMKIPG